MNIKKSPCYNCADRKRNCHSNCDKYKEWHDFQYDAKKQVIPTAISEECAYFKRKVTEYGVFRSKKK